MNKPRRDVDPAAFAIAGRVIAADRPAFIIAEAGVNHGGDPALARRLIDIAADAKADAVKFQTWKTELVIHPSAPKAEYQQAATGDNGGQFDMVQKLELSQDEFRALASYAERRGILFLSTAFDRESLAFLVALGVPALKVPSGDINNALMLRPVARTGLPVVLSTGMAALDEVRAAVDMLRAGGAGPIAVLQCTSNYPAEPGDANLRAIPAMAAALGLTVGYSDHTLGATTALAARALGAALFEKHFTSDKSLPGPDHQASAGPDELAAYIAGIRQVEAALGDGIKRPRDAETGVRQVARRSLYLQTPVAAGAVIGEDDLLALRPEGGIAPDRVDDILGRRAARDLPKGRRLEWSDVS
ncbi:MAG TPA: N-acetylneuraminate synthase family protein [Stellaceae bacterium]|nr:N-acetylneuraminate synthase family protein [Stellaceae bacterium]